MKKLHFISFILSFLFLPITLHAQAPPQREMRGVWIATVFQIDYPAVATTNENVLKADWIRMIDKHKAMGINALFVQIRGIADAFYPSQLVPWSAYLTGRSGLAPDNNFDPLAFMVQTAHERGMEFHAWLNPFRASMDNPSVAAFPDNHVLKAHPDWCIFYNKKYFINPGLPQVRAHIKDVVAEIVTKYDIDAIHFDDYFYPDKQNNENINDQATYTKYRGSFNNIDDWRRNNIDLLIYDVSKTIKQIKSSVQFGISPFGVWRNRSRDPAGSDTRAGITSYDDLYADVRKWLAESWIDYVVPQVYWSIGFSKADYARIVPWWAANSFGKPVYIGHAVYKIGEFNQEHNWSNPNEMPRQIRLARSIPNIKGSVFFSSNWLIKNKLGVGDSLKYNYYRNSDVITPTIIANTGALSCEPMETRAITSNYNGSVQLKWQASMKIKEKVPFQYLIYRFPIGQIDFSNGHNIIAIIPYDPKLPNELTFYNLKGGETYLYAVRVSDCVMSKLTIDNQSVVSNSVRSPTVSKARKRVGWWKSFWRRVFGK